MMMAAVGLAALAVLVTWGLLRLRHDRPAHPEEGRAVYATPAQGIRHRRAQRASVDAGRERPATAVTE